VTDKTIRFIATASWKILNVKKFSSFPRRLGLWALVYAFFTLSIDVVVDELVVGALEVVYFDEPVVMQVGGQRVLGVAGHVHNLGEAWVRE
jgi:hypothetical protein